MILKDKVAIVTGASRGIGREIALMLAKEGAHVAFNYLKSTQEAENLAQTIRDLGQKALPLQIDIRDFEKAKELVERTRQEFSRLDILINNAGITKDKALMLMGKEDWLDVLDTNLNGTFNITRNVIVGLLKQKSGDIINISSVSGIIGLSRQTNYAASKAGMIGFTKALAKEVAPYNIRVNAVAPGFIETDIISAMKEELKSEFKKHIPLERFGTCGEVASCVKFLLSDSAKFITGQVITVDGGLSIQI